MAKGLSLPKQFRGSGELRDILASNMRVMLTHINTQLVAKEEDGGVILFAAPLVVLPSVESTGTTVGFYGGTPVTKPVVTGARGGNVALASLLTALSDLGLISNNSTA